MSKLLFAYLEFRELGTNRNTESSSVKQKAIREWKISYSCDLTSAVRGN